MSTNIGFVLDLTCTLTTKHYHTYCNDINRYMIASKKKNIVLHDNIAYTFLGNKVRQNSIQKLFKSQYCNIIVTHSVSHENIKKLFNTILDNNILVDFKYVASKEDLINIYKHTIKSYKKTIIVNDNKKIYNRLINSFANNYDSIDLSSSSSIYNQNDNESLKKYNYIHTETNENKELYTFDMEEPKNGEGLAITEIERLNNIIKEIWTDMLVIQNEDLFPFMKKKKEIVEYNVGTYNNIQRVNTSISDDKEDTNTGERKLVVYNKYSSANTNIPIDNTRDDNTNTEKNQLIEYNDSNSPNMEIETPLYDDKITFSFL